MTIIKINENEIELDENGFLKEPEKWNAELAIELAKLQNIELTKEHWQVINYIREYFLEYGIAPVVKRITQNTSIDTMRISEIFPEGPAQGACKIAGLPEPTGCV